MKTEIKNKAIIISIRWHFCDSDNKELEIFDMLKNGSSFDDIEKQTNAVVWDSVSDENENDLFDHVYNLANDICWEFANQPL